MTAQPSSDDVLFPMTHRCCPPTASQSNPVHNTTNSLTSQACFHLQAFSALLSQKTGYQISGACPAGKSQSTNRHQLSNRFQLPKVLKLVQPTHQKYWVADGLPYTYIRRSALSVATAGHSSPEMSKAPTKQQTNSFHLRKEPRASKTSLRYNCTWKSHMQVTFFRGHNSWQEKVPHSIKSLKPNQ